ncbi:MAG TPA: hypothetical protein VGF86_03920 [Candidatus Tumulicola sp.]
MKRIASLLIALLALSGVSAGPAPHLHLVYEFGYNTKAASAGQGTGTTTVDILGPAKDGGVMISGTDYWWNTARPRAANTCEVYPNGNVNCAERPYAISPMQLTLFPMLGHSYFKALDANAKATWTHTFTVYAAVIPGGSGSLGTPNTWKSTYSYVGKGAIPDSSPLVLVQAHGRLAQQGGNHLKADSKQRIAYDPVHKVPAVISDVRTYVPQTSVYSNALVSLQLTKINGKL